MNKNMDPHDIQNWIERVERASECAVAEVFPSKKSKINPKANGYVMAIETIDQLHDHDDAYTEAQDLLREWLNSKIRPELEYEETEEIESYVNNSEKLGHTPEMISRMPENFEELYSYLEQEKEDTTAQTFLQQLLETKVVESGILKDLGEDEERHQTKCKDPRLKMEARHQQVKESRLKRQAKLEQQKQEKAMKKFAQSKAQQLLQEEDRRKALQAKKEEEHIRKEMVQLRKEMMERRCIIGEAKRLEQVHLEKQKKKLLVHEKVKQALMELQEQQDQERLKIKHLQVMQQVEARIKAYQLQCLQKHFSVWYKLVLERRIKMGKARALFDWKSQLRAFQAWRTLVWGKKLEQEVQRTEMELREEKRKNQLATDCNRKHRLRYCFTNWQIWCKTEKGKRELEERKEETKQKMAALLDSAYSGKLSANSNRASKHICETQQIVCVEEESQDDVKKMSSSSVNSRIKQANKTQQIRAKSPKFAWQVTRKHAALSLEDTVHTNDTSKISNGSQGSQKSDSVTTGKVIQYLQGNFEHRHRFQQQLIEKQKKQLEEQQKTIAELQDNQQLAILREEAKLASAITAAIGNASQKVQTESIPLGRRQSGNTQPKMKGAAIDSFSSAGPSSLEESSCPSTSINHSKTIHNLISPHPIVKAMEERAKQRLARRKQLEELKRKKEQERVARLTAEEEERQRQLEAEKQASLEKKHEERRLQRQREVEKQRRCEKEKQLQSAAEKHYQDFLLQKKGLEPWKKLLEISKKNLKLAEDHHSSSLLHICLRTWHQSVTESLAEKNFKAEKVYNGILLKRCFNNWLKYKDYCTVEEAKAWQHYLTALTRTTFNTWFGYVTEEKIASWEKERIGEQHNYWRIVKRAFRAWKSLPMLIKEEVKKKERIQHLRKKVAEILPDFQA
ncbi:coiled-coil domain-containing protein 191 isoform X2 [Chiloscyllium plagiosum]|uniref:coiled-coil domain-containing protein 191 isoform X2 n=1 Tax=Chiloscyllium plagiosum TaxID=36176 RepID=UPI001CB80809|nr:coiled-coil domain-containing protein 191 isoform X2 [Chiloscyllium plagiosum]